MSGYAEYQVTWHRHAVGLQQRSFETCEWNLIASPSVVEAYVGNWHMLGFSICWEFDVGKPSPDLAGPATHHEPMIQTSWGNPTGSVYHGARW